MIGCFVDIYEIVDQRCFYKFLFIRDGWFVIDLNINTNIEVNKMFGDYELLQKR